MKAITEASFLEGLERDGITVSDLQKRACAALGFPVGTLETADIVVGGDWPTPIFGAKRYRCDDCEGYVSLAPSSQRMLAERPHVRVICMRCAQREAQ
jgi:3-hydroxyacyl-CoA dehydrogenase